MGRKKERVHTPGNAESEGGGVSLDGFSRSLSRRNLAEEWRILRLGRLVFRRT